MTLVMGILNVTPDSFSDGGSFLDQGAAVGHANTMIGQGADIVDVGGESTRPGAGRVPLDEELRRVIPVVSALAASGVRVSVDTMRAEVAREAAEAGAEIINDVSGGLADEEMLATVARTGLDFVVMHWRGHSQRMQQRASYDDVVGEVIAELSLRRDAAVAAGIDPARIVLDPGLGFAKTATHNWQLLRDLGRLNQLGHRIVVGASRKDFLGRLLDARAPAQRDAATAAVSFWAAQHGVWAVRTHEIQCQVDAIAVARELSRGAGALWSVAPEGGQPSIASR